MYLNSSPHTSKCWQVETSLEMKQLIKKGCTPTDKWSWNLLLLWVLWNSLSADQYERKWNYKTEEPDFVFWYKKTMVSPRTTNSRCTVRRWIARFSKKETSQGCSAPKRSKWVLHWWMDYHLHTVSAPSLHQVQETKREAWKKSRNNSKKSLLSMWTWRSLLP